jgi:hypothetical protein
LIRVSHCSQDCSLWSRLRDIEYSFGQQKIRPPDIFKLLASVLVFKRSAELKLCSEPDPSGNTARLVACDPVHCVPRCAVVTPRPRRNRISHWVPNSKTRQQTVAKILTITISAVRGQSIHMCANLHVRVAGTILSEPVLSSYRASNGIAQYLRGGILEQNDERESPMDLSFRFNVPTGLEV